LPNRSWNFEWMRNAFREGAVPAALTTPVGTSSDSVSEHSGGVSVIASGSGHGGMLSLVLGRKMKEMEVCAAVTKFPVTADVTGDGFGAVEDVTELSDQKREK